MWFASWMSRMSVFLFALDRIVSGTLREHTECKVAVLERDPHPFRPPVLALDVSGQHKADGCIIGRMDVSDRHGPRFPLRSDLCPSESHCQSLSLGSTQIASQG